MHLIITTQPRLGGGGGIKTKLFPAWGTLKVDGQAEISCCGAGMVKALSYGGSSSLMAGISFFVFFIDAVALLMTS